MIECFERLMLNKKTRIGDLFYLIKCTHMVTKREQVHTQIANAILFSNDPKMIYVICENQRMKNSNLCQRAKEPKCITNGQELNLYQAAKNLILSYTMQLSQCE